MPAIGQQGAAGRVEHVGHVAQLVVDAPRFAHPPAAGRAHATSDHAARCASTSRATACAAARLWLRQVAALVDARIGHILLAVSTPRRMVSRVASISSCRPSLSSVKGAYSISVIESTQVYTACVVETGCRTSVTLTVPPAFSRPRVATTNVPGLSEWAEASEVVLLAIHGVEMHFERDGNALRIAYLGNHHLDERPLWRRGRPGIDGLLQCRSRQTRHPRGAAAALAPVSRRERGRAGRVQTQQRDPPCMPQHGQALPGIRHRATQRSGGRSSGTCPHMHGRDDETEILQQQLHFGLPYRERHGNELHGQRLVGLGQTVPVQPFQRSVSSTMKSVLW
ncbi:hypothetical protein RLIN73S_02478 [Rhodanobacter lindaniclasticus]